ncbi:MAG: bifunctional folylpolyglutamate synthase/dihydrofolate synthase [Armatimonadetes bacterium]|nr:bifunctional folylpolyglutamate synthase/dihydrofolate synthase [Armatimonadota bacterium]
MTYEQSLEYLDGLLKFGIKFGLERIAALCDAFDNPQRQLRVIHVAGTNGKGSTCTFVASILHEAGYRTGLYLSPYVHDLRERIQIDGTMVAKSDFAEIISEIKPVADRIGKTDLGEVTEFEVKTMAAYLYFARKQVDFAVLEVGMGGRFDATNLVQPMVAVITNIGLDHTERLGETIDEIAFEKAGIIKTGSVLVTAVEDERAWRVILNRCREQGVEAWRVIKSQQTLTGSPSADVQLRYNTKGDHFSLRRGERVILGLKPGLAGAFQHVNAATAVGAILALEKYEVRIPEPAILSGVANAYIPGRMEILRDKPTLVIDGAHNPGAARTLAKSIKESFRYEKLILVIGMLGTHSAEGVLSHLAPMASTIIATQSQWSKALPAGDLADEAHKFTDQVEIAEPVPEAVRRALEIAGENDLILVTGSFYTIGEVGPV